MMSLFPSVGVFSCIGVTIPLKRRYQFYLIQIFAPSIMIVILSWISFWLNTDAIPARVSLGILTVLTKSSSGNMSVGMSQQVSYIRAIDVWNVVCLMMVFGALLEFAYVCTSVRVQERRKQDPMCSVCQKVHDNKEVHVSRETFSTFYQKFEM